VLDPPEGKMMTISPFGPLAWAMGAPSRDARDVFTLAQEIRLDESNLRRIVGDNHVAMKV
jgi:NAD-dependent oxidoreductase involved in siderophore biosynthesis